MREEPRKLPSEGLESARETPIEVAYWFVPLADALELPDHHVVKFSDRPKISAQALTDEHDESEMEQFFDPFLANGVSLLFWQREQPLTDPMALGLVLDVAMQALPSLSRTTPEDTEHTSPEDPREFVTVVEMAALLDPDKPEEDRLTDAFDRGLDCIRRVQRAFYATTEKPLRMVARETLPPVLPMAVRQIRSEDDGWPNELSLWALNDNFGNMVRQGTLSADDTEHFHLALSRDETAFKPYLDFRREAVVSLERQGDYRAAILNSATAAEVLLDDLLMHLLWEEGKGPEESSVLFEDPRAGLIVRVRSQYHTRLRGSWDPSAGGAVAGWLNAIVKLRHQVVHGGYRPSLSEAQEAYRALLQLERHVGDRLAAAVLNSKYLRTAYVFCGESGLTKRGALTRRVVELAKRPTEPVWAETFARWRGVVNRLRARADGIAMEPDAARAVLLLVVYPGGTTAWVTHDTVTEMAAWVDESWDQLSPPQADGIRKTLEMLRQEEMDEPISLWIGGITGVEPREQWVEVYRRLPLYGVLVGGNDVERPSL